MFSSLLTKFAVLAVVLIRWVGGTALYDASTIGSGSNLYVLEMKA